MQVVKIATIAYERVGNVISKIKKFGNQEELTLEIHRGRICNLLN